MRDKLLRRPLLGFDVGHTGPPFNGETGQLAPDPGRSVRYAILVGLIAQRRVRHEAPGE